MGILERYIGSLLKSAVAASGLRPKMGAISLYRVFEKARFSLSSICD
jgi:hypothetical protein